MRKEVPVSQLQFGMYIAELDRPWTEAPFWFQGFLLKTPEELATLKKLCRTVWVDVARSELPEAPPSARAVYVEKATVEQELAPARKAYTGSETSVRTTLAAVRVGRTLDAATVKGAVRSLTESVLRNPDAMLLFSQLRKKGEYAVSHSLDVSVYMTAFGRFLQLEEAQIEFLGYVGLLQDIGKVRLPNALLEKHGPLNPAEREQAKLHVRYSAEILRATPGIPAEVARVALLHHERHDGSGYPGALRGHQIGMIGSIAAIVDTFDALSVKRPYADAVSPSAAISTIYKSRGLHYDANLVEQFIRFIGIFPVGSLVELNTGEIGVVISQNPNERLKPRVMVIRDQKGNPLQIQKLLDLSRSPKATSDEPYRILRSLEAGYVTISSEEIFMK